MLGLSMWCFGARAQLHELEELAELGIAVT
jgi:hypothetical protein